MQHAQDRRDSRFCQPTGGCSRGAGAGACPAHRIGAGCGCDACSLPNGNRPEFNEAIEGRFSKIAIEAKGGTPIATELVSTDPADKKVLIIKLKAPLQPGAYQVSWRVVSVDTHKINGSFAFQVKPEAHAVTQRGLNLPDVLIILRAVHFGATMLVAGTMLFSAVVAEPVWRQGEGRDGPSI